MRAPASTASTVGTAARAMASAACRVERDPEQPGERGEAGKDAKPRDGSTNASGMHNPDGRHQLQDTDRDSGNEIRNVDDRSGIEVAENLAAGKMSAPAPRTAYHPRATLSVKDREGVHNTHSTCRTCGATAAESLAVFTRRLPSVIVPLASMKTAVRCRTSGPSRGTARRSPPGDPRQHRDGIRSARHFHRGTRWWRPKRLSMAQFPNDILGEPRDRAPGLVIYRRCQRLAPSVLVRSDEVTHARNGGQQQ